MPIGSNGGIAVKSSDLVAAPLFLAVLACCGHLFSLPRQLDVLRPYTYMVFHALVMFSGGRSRVFLRSFVIPWCEVHHTVCVINHIYFERSKFLIATSQKKSARVPVCRVFD